MLSENPMILKLAIEYKNEHIMVFIFFSKDILCLCSAMPNSVNPCTVAHQVPLSMGFSRQEHWSELTFLTPGDLPDLGIQPTSLVSPTLAEGFFTIVPSGKQKLHINPVSVITSGVLIQTSFSIKARNLSRNSLYLCWD